MSVPVTNITFMLKVVVVFTFLIGSTYGIIIPMFFPDYKTYTILTIGIAIAAFISGYVGFQNSTTSTFLIKIGVGLIYASMVAILVLFLSLLIILNVRGS